MDDKNMQTQTYSYFAIWKHNLENVCLIILIPIILFQCTIFFIYLHFVFCRKMDNRDDIVTV